jgi:hypothetical protein
MDCWRAGIPLPSASVKPSISSEILGWRCGFTCKARAGNTGKRSNAEFATGLSKMAATIAEKALGDLLKATVLGSEKAIGLPWSLHASCGDIRSSDYLV